jgi:Protein of unknown function (DUF3237)
MIEPEYEMTSAETIEGPIGRTSRSPFGGRLCWLVAAATLRGPRIDASLAIPGVDLMRLGNDGIRRPDLRVQLMTDDEELILLRYDVAVIRPTPAFVDALTSGGATDFGDQYMRIAPQFEVSAGNYSWLAESVFVGRGRLTGERVDRVRDLSRPVARSWRGPARARCGGHTPVTNSRATGSV